MLAINRVARAVFSKSSPDAFDLHHGVDTAGHVPRWRLLLSSVNAWHGTRYQPIDEGELLVALAFIGSTWDSFTFIDLGCGKGRALVIAERLGFSRVIGVEYNSSLARIARRNVNQSTIVQHGDAGLFPIPNGDVVVFLYNPFAAKVMRPVLNRIERHQGRLFVLYNNPECGAMFDASPCLDALGKVPGTPTFYAWKRASRPSLR